MYPDHELPSYIDSSVKHLPPDEKFQHVKDLDFTEDALKAVVTLGEHYVFESCDSLHDYEEWAKYLGHPEVPVYVASRWEMDVEFGRQMLNGVNPVHGDPKVYIPPSHLSRYQCEGVSQSRPHFRARDGGWWCDELFSFVSTVMWWLWTGLASDSSF